MEKNNKKWTKNKLINLGAISVAISASAIAVGYAIYQLLQANHEYKRKIIVFDNRSQKVNNNVLNLLDKKVAGVQKNRTMMPYLQYIYLLKPVIITDSNNTDENDGGYYPQTDQIVLNTSTMIDRLGQNALDQDKAEYMYEIFFHEYNHFLNNLLPTDPLSSKNIYSNGKLETWNLNFVNDFKHNLGYDLPGTPTYSTNRL